MSTKTTFGVIVTTRGFFNPDLARAGRRELLAKLDQLGYGYVILPYDATPTGAVETVEDAQKCARLFQERAAEIDGVIVSLPNFGDEVGVVTALDKARLNVPILVQACDDDLDKMSVDQRRDSFCGKLSVCNNLYQYGIKFTNTSTHTYPIGSEDFTRDLAQFARICRVVKGLRTARIAQIGTRPTPFQTVRYSEKLLQTAGITVVPVDLSEILFAAQRLGETAAVRDKVKEIRAYGRIPAAVTEEAVTKAARLAVTVETWLAEQQCVAGAMQCWSSVQQNFGCAACLPMSMLSDKGIPMACEVDIAGAVSMYALWLASGQPSGYLDWNNNYRRERDKCICTHCSAYPKGFIAADFEVSPLDILGKSLGAENCFGACKANVAAGPMTFAKISTDDARGIVKAYVGEGEFTADPVSTPGGIAVCKVDRLQELLDYLCRQGYEHHVAMNRTQAADVLAEAFGKYLGWEVYRHR